MTTHTLADSYVLYIIAMNVHTPASSYFTSQYSLYMADISLMPSVVITHIRVIILLVYILVMCSVVISVLHTYTVCTEYSTHTLAVLTIIHAYNHSYHSDHTTWLNTSHIC